MDKPKVVEVPPDANEQVVRIQLEQIAKAVKDARAGNKCRVRVTIQRE